MLERQQLAQRSNFIFEENEEMKNIDNEVEQINAKNSTQKVIEDPLLNLSSNKFYQNGTNTALGHHHQLQKPPSRTKFLNQTQNQ